MNIQGTSIWQVAAGDTKRDYVDLCLVRDVILNGPGEYGPWPICEEMIRSDGYTAWKIADLRRFCEKIQDGDFVVLRLGLSAIYGVGQVVGDYKHSNAFNDVDGWTLAHVRRVRWLWKYKEKPKEFEGNTLKRGTTQRLSSPHVELWLKTLQISDTEYERPLVDLPEDGRCANISVNEISEYLFDKGVASHSISNLLDQINELIRIAKWYNRSEVKPSEYETISYLVVPLLRALGWTPQRMAIEWKRIDVALFTSLPRHASSLSVVVEAKPIKSASLSALSQAKQYAKEYKNCARIILTDGLRYGVFVRESMGSREKLKFSLDSYLNLTDLRAVYPIFKCNGAADALWTMSPEWKI